MLALAGSGVAAAGTLHGDGSGQTAAAGVARGAEPGGSGSAGISSGTGASPGAPVATSTGGAEASGAAVHGGGSAAFGASVDSGVGGGGTGVGNRVGTGADSGVGGVGTGVGNRVGTGADSGVGGGGTGVDSSSGSRGDLGGTGPAVTVSPIAAPGQSAAGAKAVSYLGHTFTVPADWSVVDLSQAPHTCVRFDVHAVYLGTPSSEQSCAEQTAAPVEGAIVVQPAVSGAAASAEDVPIERRITATLPNASITASYGAADRAEVTAILAGAGVPAPVVTQSSAGAATTATASATAGVVKQNVTPYSGTVTPAVVAQFTANVHGTGFDTCDAPSTDDMTAWGASPYLGVGVYFGGAERACTQQNLNASWVSTETAAGWHLLPLYIGLQVVNGEVTNTSGAAAQGKAAAQDAVDQASNLGIGQGAVLYYDMENHSTGAAYTAAEVTATQQFISGWTAELHTLGYLSGMYGNENGAQGAMVAGEGKAGITEPDVMDVANWNGLQDDDPGSDTAGFWNQHRVHQFVGPTNETYGGVTIQVDEDFFDLGPACASVAPAPTGGVVRSHVFDPCSRLPLS